MSRHATRTLAAICGVCPADCGVDIQLDNGKIARLSPRKDHPKGICCPRGSRAAEIVYSPDRVLYPMKRIGARGAGRFERIGWDEALDLLAQGLRDIASAHGPEAVCMYTGRGTFEQSLCDLLTPAGVHLSSAWSLLFPFGSPNTTGVGAICYVAHGMIAPVSTYGVYAADTFADIEQADLVVIWGANPSTDSPSSNVARIKAARQRGAEIVAIDHRRIDIVKATAGRWLGIRPGTDGALALGMIRVVIEEERYDHDFVAGWTLGFDALRTYVQPFTPQRVEAITGVSADEVVRTARAIAGARGAALVSYTGLEYTNSGTQNIRAILTLWAITGNLDVPGGNVVRMPSTVAINRSTRLEAPTGVDPIGKSRYPLYHHFRKEAHAMELPRAILHGDPYPVRGMLITGSSIITSYPNPEQWRRSFAALDFLAVIDRFRTADSQYADLILPSTTLFENESYSLYPDSLHWRARVIEPQGEARSDWDIARAIAERLGYGALLPANSDEMLERALAGSGVTTADLRGAGSGIHRPAPPLRYRKWESGLLRPDGQAGFDTPSGKFEIASSLLVQHGYPALPEYVEPAESPISTPELARIYPLVFNSGARIHSDFRSQHHNIGSLLKLQPHPLVSLHPEDAAARGIANGDVVEIVSPRGKVRYVATITPDIVRGVIEANAGGGSPDAVPAWQQNINELTDADNRDPISGFPVYKALLCDVVKANRATADPPLA
ncbi:molybdopterin-containing oxidoreductase family protein [Paludibacterium yongneupense]|uniref:molybdopterin-containing oxidoreductase family protein n=1 Tax=Paludibacterium yongneupense TaxID=400061 RepID=UPI00041D3779|nr:molybdopterin-dependent oxidoreductase [Paludibacterium yongneupense]